jgi:hypothetical protein
MCLDTVSTTCGSGWVDDQDSQQIAPEEHDVYSLAVFISLRAPEERNVLLGEELHAAPTERDDFKIPGAINILLLRSKESRKLKATLCKA